MALDFKKYRQNKAKQAGEVFRASHRKVDTDEFRISRLVSEEEELPEEETVTEDDLEAIFRKDFPAASASSPVASWEDSSFLAEEIRGATKAVETPSYAANTRPQVTPTVASTVAATTSGSLERIARMVLVMDGTTSFTTVFPKIYFCMEKLLKELEGERKKYPGIQVEYSLVTIHDTPQMVRFASSNGWFTSKEKEVLDALQNMEFYGGRMDGYEDVESAINMALQLISNEKGADKAENGLMVFTDATQLIENTQFGLDFSSDEPGMYGDYTNVGLRFAKIYSYEGSLTPYFKVTDHYGRYAGGGKNVVNYEDISNVVEQGSEQIVNAIRRLMEEILNQMSVN